MLNETNIILRTDANNNVIAVSETNTKLTFVHYKTITVGRYVAEIEVLSIKSTIKARAAYFMYNNRVARAKRAAVASYKAAVLRVQRTLASMGVSIYSTY